MNSSEECKENCFINGWTKIKNILAPPNLYSKEYAKGIRSVLCFENLWKYFSKKILFVIYTTANKKNIGKI